MNVLMNLSGDVMKDFVMTVLMTNLVKQKLSQLGLLH